MPVFWGLADALVFAVIVAATVTILLNVATLAIALRLPPMARRVDVANAITASAAMLLIVTGFVFLASVSLHVAGFHDLSAITAGVCIQLIAQGAFTIGQATLTWRLDYASIMGARFAYASFSFAGTFVACITVASGFGIVLAAAVGYALGFFFMLFRSRTMLRFRRLTSWRGVRSDLRHSRGYVASYFVGAFASQANALVLPLLDAAVQGVWAVVVRVSSGVQTFGSQIVGPKIDVLLAAEIQSAGSLVRRRRVFRLAGLLSAAVGGLSAAACGLAILILDPTVLTQGGATTLTLLVALLGQAGFATSLSVVGRVLGIVGGARRRFVWEFSRAIGTIAVLLFLRGPLLLLGIGVVGVASALLYWYLVAHSQGHQRSARQPRFQEE